MPLLVQHVRLTVVSVLIGALIAFPLALLARRSRCLAGPVLGLSTLVYTIPSLAMFAFVAPVHRAVGDDRRRSAWCCTRW